MIARRRPVVPRVARVLSIGLMLLVGWALEARAEERFVREFEVPPGGSLVVQLERGHIQVETHDHENLLRLETEARGLGASSVEFEVERNGDVVRLRGTQADWLDYTTVPPRIAVRAWVPERYAVNLETADGEVVARGIRGSLAVRSAGGSIELNEVAGPVLAETDGGAVRASFSESPQGRLESGGGDIVLNLPAEAEVTLDARSRGGQFWSDGSVTLPAGNHGQHWHGRLNGGGAPLELHGAGGDIRVRSSH